MKFDEIQQGRQLQAMHLVEFWFVAGVPVLFCAIHVDSICAYGYEYGFVSTPGLRLGFSVGLGLFCDAFLPLVWESRVCWAWIKKYISRLNTQCIHSHWFMQRNLVGYSTTSAIENKLPWLPKNYRGRTSNKVVTWVTWLTWVFLKKKDSRHLTAFCKKKPNDWIFRLNRMHTTPNINPQSQTNILICFWLLCVTLFRNPVFSLHGTDGDLEGFCPLIIPHIYTYSNHVHKLAAHMNPWYMQVKYVDHTEQHSRYIGNGPTSASMMSKNLLQC